MEKDYLQVAPDGEDIILLWGTSLIEGALYKLRVKGTARLGVSGCMILEVHKIFSTR